MMYVLCFMFYDFCKFLIIFTLSVISLINLQVEMSSSWTTQDKNRLLALLQEHGAGDLEVIQRGMPHKSIAEIRLICQMHTNMAMNKWLSEKGKRYEKHNYVNNWLDVLKRFNTPKVGPVADIIPRALKYIALYEKRRNTTHIHLKDCYLVLSNISNGIASKKLDETSNYFLFHCLTKLAESLKNGETQSYRSYLKSLINFDECQRNYDMNKDVLNPLAVPKDLLIMTEVEKKSNIFEDSSSKVQLNLEGGFLHSQ